MMEFSRKHLALIAWSLVGASNLVGLIIWGDTLGWDVSNVNNYSLFPLLGLIAFNTMWAQYCIGVIRKLSGVDKSVLQRFSNITGVGVTTTILLHPLLLIWQLWRDGSGLPPNSYLQYINPSLKWALLLGVLSLFVFLAYELRHRFHERSWWRYVDYANDAAIVAIYIHAFNLGSHTHLSWFFPLWIFYGVTLVAALLHKHFTISKRQGWIVAGILLVAFGAATVGAKASSSRTETSSGTTSTQSSTSEPSGISPNTSTSKNANETSSPSPSSVATTTPNSPVANQAANTITIGGSGFSPAEITVKKGSPVIWLNSDSQQHAVDKIGDNAGPHSPPLNQNESFTYTFKDKGAYKFTDAFYPERTGSIIVTD